MARAKTKDELLAASKEQYAKLSELIDGMSDADKQAVFLFEDRDKNLRDVIVHLHEWHNMMRRWYKVGVLEMGLPDTPRKGYTWRTLPAMNQLIWQEWQGISLDESLKLLDESHSKMLSLMNERSNEELFGRKVYPFTKGTTLGAYFVSACPSHYDWAMKKIKKQVRLLKQNDAK